MTPFRRVRIADHHSESHICQNIATMATSSYPLPASDHGLRDIKMAIRDEKLELETPQHQVSRHTLQIQQFESLGTPIHRLDEDVLLEIFLYLLGRPHGLQHPAVMLSTICRRWRVLALRSPHLWTTVSLNLEGDMDKYLGQSLESFLSLSRNLPLDFSLEVDERSDRRGARSIVQVGARKYLGRSLQSFLSLSRNLPLSTSLLGRNKDHLNRPITRIRTLISSLVFCVSRWKTVEVHFNSPASYTYHTSLLKYEPELYSQLEALNLVIPYGMRAAAATGQAHHIGELAILHAPSLRKLVLNRWKLTWPIPSSWSQLRELELIDQVDQAILVLMMSACPQLTKLKMDVYRPANSLSIPPPTGSFLGHPVTSLSITFHSLCHFSQVHLHQTPALRTLSLTNKIGFWIQDDYGPDSSDGIFRIIKSCTSTLVDLRLHQCGFLEPTLIQILELVPSIKHLHIETISSGSSPTLFEHLTSVEDHTGASTSAPVLLCPNLASLNLCVGHSRPWEVDQQIEWTFSLIASRIAQGISFIRIFSDAWTTFQSRKPKWMDKLPATSYKEVLIRQSKKEEMERRIVEMRDVWGVWGLRLECDNLDQPWNYGGLPDRVINRFKVNLVGHAVVYEAGPMPYSV